MKRTDCWTYSRRETAYVWEEAYQSSLEDFTAILRIIGQILGLGHRKSLLTKRAVAKVSNPSNTRSAFGAANSSSLTSNCVLKDQFASPTPTNVWLRFNAVAATGEYTHIALPIRSSRRTRSRSQDGEMTAGSGRRTGSGIFPCFNSSTCTVVGKDFTGNHSPSSTTSPPPICVKLQPSLRIFVDRAGIVASVSSVVCFRGCERQRTQELTLCDPSGYIENRFCAVDPGK